MCGKRQEEKKRPEKGGHQKQLSVIIIHAAELARRPDGAIILLTSPATCTHTHMQRDAGAFVRRAPVGNLQDPLFDNCLQIEISISGSYWCLSCT